ncbi:hypothetical protein AYI69_g8992 [Smittium culicis]|uniref:CCHC-type domain-containing protein n=1 Tax=Smittium culicis TaxID=133412 RepID=A0A1R1XFS7_9FUNG|nr:hypothetical protein AYI69_g8992 [Smittium culicis]
MSFPTDYMPKKFLGNGKDTDNVQIWVKKVKIVSELQKWPEETQFSILKICLEGPAAKWQNKIEEIGETKTWKTEDWLKKLNEKFKSDVIELEGDTETLRQMKKNDDETFREFNLRFTEYLTTIPKNLYITTWIIKIYIKILNAIDRYVWWTIVQKEEFISLLELMVEAARLQKVMEVNKNDLVEETEKQVIASKKIIPVKDANVSEISMKEQIEYLTESVRKLHLLSQRNQPKRDYSTVKCYNCGKTGHASLKCTLPYDPNNKLKYANNLKDNSAMLTLKVEEDPDISNIFSLEPPNAKVLRVEDLLNNNTSVFKESQNISKTPTVLHRLGINKKKAFKKPPKKT